MQFQRQDCRRLDPGRWWFRRCNATKNILWS